MSRDKNVALDVTLDVTISAIILATVQVAVYGVLGPKQVFVTTAFMLFMACWKLVSPITETQTGPLRYLHTVGFVILAVIIVLVSLML